MSHQLSSKHYSAETAFVIRINKNAINRSCWKNHLCCTYQLLLNCNCVAHTKSTFTRSNTKQKVIRCSMHVAFFPIMITSVKTNQFVVHIQFSAQEKLNEHIVYDSLFFAIVVVIRRAKCAF